MRQCDVEESVLVISCIACMGDITPAREGYVHRTLRVNFGNSRQPSAGGKVVPIYTSNRIWSWSPQSGGRLDRPGITTASYSKPDRC